MDKIEYIKDGVRLTLEVIDQKVFDRVSCAAGRKLEMFDEETPIYIQAKAQALIEASETDLLSALARTATDTIDHMKFVRYYEMVEGEFERGERIDNPEAHREQQEWLNSL